MVLDMFERMYEYGNDREVPPSGSGLSGLGLVLGLATPATVFDSAIRSP